MKIRAAIRLPFLRYDLYRINLNVLSVFLILFQSFGIRFFSGQGILLGGIIVLLNFKNLLQFRLREIIISALILVFVLVVSVLSVRMSFKSLVFQLLLVFESLLVLVNYQTKSNPEQFRVDLRTALSFFYYHALVGYLLYLPLQYLFADIRIGGFPYRTLGGFFYVMNKNGFLDLDRNTGLLWEPGILQLVLNLYFFLVLREGKLSVTKGILIVAVLLSAYSTTGLMLLFVNLGYFLFFKKKASVKYIIGVLPVAVLLFALFFSNIQQKVLEGTDTSGLIRFRDVAIGIMVIKNYPITGIGMIEPESLGNLPSVMNLEEDFLSMEYLSQLGYLSGGYTNGFFFVFIQFGLVVGIVIYYLFFKLKFIDGMVDKIVFSSICVVTFMTEPITNTAFFYLIFLSAMIFYQKGKIKIVSE